MPCPPHSSSGHSSGTVSTSPVTKRKKSDISGSKDQSKVWHGPFYKATQPTLSTAPADVLQKNRNDFYCWLCHREGQVLCCELCPRVYHAKCLKLPAETKGDWLCPQCEKITAAESFETQSKAMMLLTADKLSYLLKFALQKMKQPGTEPFQKAVSLEQCPDYAEYIFHPVDLCMLEKNIKKKLYGCTEAFLADTKWILHNCVIYNGGNHKLTATAKVIVQICEHEMSEIKVCPECYLLASQKRNSWFCEPCSKPHSLIWAKLKGFPFWPAKAIRDKDGLVDVCFFGKHDRAWAPLNNCYLISKELPFSVKKTKSIFSSAMQEMEVYIENVKKKFGVFNYASFRTLYTPGNTFQTLDPSNCSSSVNVKIQDKTKKADLSVNDCYGKEHSDFKDSKKTGCDCNNATDDKQKTEDGHKKAIRDVFKKRSPQVMGTVASSPGQRNPDKLKLNAASDNSRDATGRDNPNPNLASTENVKLSPVCKATVKEVKQTLPEDDSYSRELLIDLDDQSGKDRKKSSKNHTNKNSDNCDGKAIIPSTHPPQSSSAPSTLSALSHAQMDIPMIVVSLSAPLPPKINVATTSSFNTAASAPSGLKQHTLLAIESAPVVQGYAVWKGEKFLSFSEKWQMQEVQPQQLNQQTQAASSVESSSWQGKTQPIDYKKAVKVVHQKQALPKVAIPVTNSQAHVAAMAFSDTTSSSLTNQYTPPVSVNVAEDIAKYTSKIMDAIKSTMTEIYTGLCKCASENAISEIKQLRIETEKLHWLHQQELAEMKHNLELTMAEMRQTLEQEKELLVSEVKRQMELEKQQAVKDTKKKQWCANCRQEAIFYCCWNTSYCDYPCQQAHWPEHMKSCTQSAQT